MYWAVKCLDTVSCLLDARRNLLTRRIYQLAWENYVAIVSSLTDCLLVVLPFVIVLSIQIRKKRKIAVMFAFTMRLTYAKIHGIPELIGRLITVSTVAALVCQIVYLNATRSSTDQSLALSPVAISTQLAQYKD